MGTRPNLPAGTVTFLFTDVEGSTRLLHALGAEAYAAALAEHRRLLREAFTCHGGVEVDTQGDAFFVAFPTAPGALAAAREAQAALSSGPIRVRMGIHTGTPFLGEEGYIGPDVHRAARIAAAGHGGQVLVSAATAQLVGSDGLRDVGQHRLKDLSAPERLYQLGDGDFGPLKTLHQTNLPVPATPFLGREAEVAELTALISRDGVRLVTLTGPGGTGKTRLALAVAGGLAERYPDGVWWVPLAPLRDPALVLESVARTLGAAGELSEHIGDKRLLLLLDNFEHLMDAADGMAALLVSCPNLSLLVTSREPLHLAGEHEYAVDPLRRHEAVELFLTRAYAARRDVAANGEVARICERLDHLPLAIELAAARVKVLTPKALLERLERRLPVLAGGVRDLPERQRTLRATIEWSHELLSADEQRLFARLSVFRGGCTLEAAEAVADADLDTLQSLVDKSLVRVRGERFWMLETIREYAAERLDASGEAPEIRHHHAEHFMALAEEAFPNLRGSPREWLDRLEREHDNLRAALDWLELAGETQLRLQLAGALWKFWNMRGHFAEAERRLASALAADPRPTAARARALNGATATAAELQQLATARSRAEEALAVHRALGDPEGMANSTFLLGMVDAEEEHWAEGRRRFEESLEAFRGLGDDHYVLLVGRNLAWIYYELGEPDRGRALHEENLRRARALGNKRIEAATLQGLAWRGTDEGRWREAIGQLALSYPINRELGERSMVAQDVYRLARALAVGGRAYLAATLLGRADALAEEIGITVERVDRIKTDAAIRARLDEAGYVEARERGRSLTTDEAVALALGESEPVHT